MKSILVASDLSERSDAAVKRGIQLAQAHDARLTVVYVIDDSLPAEAAAAVETAARDVLGPALADSGLASVTIETPVGDPVDAMGEALRRVNADLLVVGPHRRRVFLEWIKETTMERLVRSSRRPVLLAIDGGDEPYKKVLSGVDLSGVCAAGLRKVQTIAPDAELSIFHAHAMTFGDEARRDYDTWRAVHGLPDTLPDPIYYEGRAQDALEEILPKGGYDLLSIGAHTRSNASRYLVGGFTASLIRQPPCDLLLAR